MTDRDRVLLGTTLRAGDPVPAPTSPHGEPATAPTLPSASASGAAHVLELLVKDPGRYQRGAEIARGGMGRIVAAYDRELAREVAIKELLVRTEDLERRFEREIAITAVLQHPAIIAVQAAGRWPDGLPFYLMQKVDGRGLDRVIHAAAPGERSSLLAHVIAVADAVAYAHSKGIVHRDLKPGNVLVGAFGETIVIDWGLAKLVHERTDAGAQATSSSNVGLTVLGQAMGTPCYMPPEQARGEEVDERADVYALGAILYHVLTGRMPYADRSSSDEVIDAVMSTPPAPLPPDVPRELAAIVEKAMRRDKADRYPDAAGVAADLRRYTAGKLVAAHDYTSWQLVARWLRKHRAAVTIGALALTALAGSGALAVQQVRSERDAFDAARVLANTARARATEQRVDLEGLVDYMLGDLVDRLEPLGKLDLLEDVANRVYAYYAKLSEHPSPDDAQRASKALFNLSLVQSARGEEEAARESGETALGLARTYAAARPNDVGAQADLIEALSQHGGQLGGMFHDADALVLFQEAVTLADALATRAPDDERVIQARARVHEYVADVRMTQGRYEDALVEHRAALEARRRLVVKLADDLDAADALAGTLGSVAVVLRRQGNFNAAIDVASESLTIIERNLQRKPDNAGWLFSRGANLYGLGEIYFDKKDYAAALRAYDAAVAVFEELTQRGPDDADYRTQWLLNRLRQADTHAKLGHRDEALSRYQSLLESVGRVVATHPDDLLNQQTLSAIHTGIGDVRLAQGRHAEALAAYKSSLAVAEGVAAAHPDASEWGGIVRGAHRDVGNALVGLRRVTEARWHFQTALELSERLRREEPEVKEHQQMVDALRTQLR